MSGEKISEIIKSDDLIFNKLIWLRLNSLVADMEVLKLFYYYQGISPIEIRLEPQLPRPTAPTSILSSAKAGNTAWRTSNSAATAPSPPPDLYRLLKSRTGSPYVPKQLSEDIDRLQNFYWNNGYDDATVSYELSAGRTKIAADHDR